MNIDLCERLSMLTAGTTFRGECTARATGQRLTFADISYLIAGLTPLQESLILAKYSGHNDAMLRAQTLVVVSRTMSPRWLRSRGKTLDARANWYKQRFDKHVDGLVTQAVNEILATKDCWTCKGTGSSITSDGKVEPCDTCSGSGHAHSMRARAKGAGIHEEQWRRDGWAFWYAEVLAFLCAEEATAKRHIARRFR